MLKCEAVMVIFENIWNFIDFFYDLNIFYLKYFFHAEFKFLVIPKNSEKCKLMNNHDSMNSLKKIN